MKTAKEILKGEMSENLWTFICSYPVSYKSEEKLVEWIIDAMQEYAAQFKQEKVTDEDIMNEARKIYNIPIIVDPNSLKFKHACIWYSGAKAMRDGLITHNK